MDDSDLEEILSRSSSAYLDECTKLSPKLPRVVISLTTVPGRYDILYDTLRTLVNQDYPVDAIYLTIPKIAKRFGTPYPDLPQRILDLVTVVNIEEDHGPICKIIGGLIMETDPDSIIITCDDDIWYSANLVSSLVQQYLLHPGHAVSGSGMFLSGGVVNWSCHAQSVFFHSWFMDFVVPEHGREVDILCGFSGVLYPRKAFPSVDNLEDMLTYTKQSSAIFHNDDILLSAYLSFKGVKRIVVPDIPWIDELRLTSSGRGQENQDEHALSHDFGQCLSRMQVAFDECLKFGLFKDRPDVSCTETVIGKALIVIIVIVIIILLIWAICYICYPYWNWPHYNNSYYASYPLLVGQVL